MIEFLKKYTVLVLLLGAFPVISSAQGECLGGGCAFGGTQFPTGTLSTTSSAFTTVSTCIYAGEWAQYSVTLGSTYEWSLCTADGGNASYDSQLTLYNATGTVTYCYSDDFCGDDAKISWTATFTGTVRVRVNRFNCSTNTVCTTLRWRVASATASNPCTSITTIPACGTSVTANLSGGGAGWSPASCGFSTPGQEAIFSFTPTVTGTYSLNVSAISGGYIDLFWINSTAGCSSSGAWNCIDDVISTGNTGAMSWTAGQTYYILADPEGTGTYNLTFSVNCVSSATNPCTSITTIPSCGSSVTANLSGTGAGWSPGACGFSTPGQEAIFSFTPATTGTYSLNVSSISGGYIDFFWINSTSGCSSGGAWNCIDDVFSTGNTGAMSWTAGQTYYILLDPEGTGTYSATFSVNCVAASGNPCTSITNIAACGTAVSTSLTGTGAGWSPGACGFTTPGQEAIFSFTAPTTGTYSLNVSSITGGFIDFFFVNSTSGCSSTAGWTCIGDVLSTGNIGAMSWTAGQTYYILLDPEGSGSYTVQFSINCPGSSVTASDCNQAVNICTNTSFQIDPNGVGTVNEIPSPGSPGNPNVNPYSSNSGCLLAGELNSTWMVVNIYSSGTLEFTFGGGGAQAGFYDWIMYPYDASACANIPTGSVNPVRCNWNGSSSGGTGLASVTPPGGSPSNFEPPLNVTLGDQYVICFSNYSSANTSVPLDFGGTASVSCVPLPVELLSFHGEQMDDFIRLSWITSTETETSHFLVQHSTDGINFREIDRKEAMGNSSVETYYQADHFNPADGMNYYRLVQVDLNEEFTFSHIVPFSFNTIFSTGKIYPNPFTKEFTLEFSSAEAENHTLEIQDITGRVLHSEMISAKAGVNRLSINNASEYKPGWYMIRLKDHNGEILSSFPLVKN